MYNLLNNFSQRNQFSIFTSHKNQFLFYRFSCCIPEKIIKQKIDFTTLQPNIAPKPQLPLACPTSW